MITCKNIKLFLFLLLIPLKVLAQTSVGTPDGQFSVNENGAAIYNVPIDIHPSGTGFDPQISLAYNSQQAGYGNVGYGISISGISVITRVGKDRFHDNDVIQKVKYEAGDNYVLDGRRLYIKSGTQGKDASTYSVEGNPYTTVTLHGDDTPSNTSIWFELKDVDGNVYQFKQLLRCYLGYPNKATKTVAWYISKATNKYNDEINYSYVNYNNTLYPSSISYGRKNSTNTVLFSYEDLSTSQKFILEGGTIGYISKKLSSITAKCQSLNYRIYTLSYNTTSDASNRKYDRLISVNVSNGSGESLKPINLGWNYLSRANIQNSTVSVETEACTGYCTKKDEGTSSFFSADVNNDGVSDIVRMWHGTVYDYYSSNAQRSHSAAYLFISKSQIDNNGKVTYQKPIRYNFPEFKDFGEEFFFAVKNIPSGANVCNIDGDNYTDLVLPYYNVWDERKACFFYVVKGCDINYGKGDIWRFGIPLSSTEEMPLYYTVDLNGDGKDEFFIVEQKKNNSGVYPAYIVSDFKNSAGEPVTTNLTFKYSLNKDIKRMCLVDCNADGLQDIMLIFENGYKIYFNNGGTDLSSVFSESNTKVVTSSSTLKDYWRMEQGDFNGDGLVDFVCIARSEWNMKCFCNNGDGTFSLTGSTSVDYIDKDTEKDDNRFTVRVADFDKDGRSDVFVSKEDLEYHSNLFRHYYSYRKTQVRWYLSDGSKLVLWKSIDKTRAEDDSNQGHIFTGDFNGDGYAEIANYGSQLNSSTNNTFTEDCLNIYSFSTDVSSGRLTNITNGFGKKTTITYAIGTNPSVYTAGNVNDSESPVKTYTLPLPLVSKVSQTNGATSTQNITYKYSDLRIHTQGRGILGFSSMTVNNTTLGSKTETKVTEWDTKRYLPLSVLSTTTIDGKTSKSQITNEIKAETAWNGNYFSYCKEKQSTDFDNHLVSTKYIYNITLGVLSRETSYYDGKTDMYKGVMYSGFKLYAGKYLPSTISRVQKHSDDNNICKVRNNYTYDSKGDVTTDEQTSMYNGKKDITLTTTYVRDPVYGKVLIEETKGNNVIAVKKCYQYDANNLRLVKSYTNPASVVKTYTYDSWGNVTKESDESNSSNILSTTYSYDNWGSLVKTVNPDGTSVSTTTEWDSSKQNGVYKTVTVATAQAPVTTYYDTEGREVYSSTNGVGGVNVNKTTHYNSLGKAEHVVNVVGKLSTTAISSYDRFGRMIYSRSENGTETSYSYNDRTVVTKTPIGKTTNTYDAWGNVIKAVDNVSSVSYTYNSFCKPTKTTSGSTTILMEYDAAGNKTKLTDSNAGTMAYSYAADGSILSQTDARGVTTNYTYDSLGRIKQKTYTDKSGKKTTQTYKYGDSGYSINRIVEKNVAGNKLTYTYDEYGRILTETHDVFQKAGKQSYTKKYTYDKYGQMSSVTYPGNMVFNYIYDNSYGYLKEINFKGYKTLYKLNNYDGLTLSTNTVAGELSNTVDSYGYPSQYKMVRNSSVLDFQTFTFDRTTGNLSNRIWTHKGNSIINESFAYDNMDRLTKVSNSNGSTAMQMTYRDNGNIASKTGVGTYKYDTKKIHAVTEVSNDSKLINSNTISTEFSLNGKISKVSDDKGCSMSYVYGPDDEKWISTLCDPSQVTTDDIEHIYFGDYEKIIKDNLATEYYFLENNVIFIKKAVSSSTSVYRAYQAVTDNLGSILAVYNENGEEVFCAKYDAWGKQTVSRNDIDLCYGYTGHEMLPQFGLINMNARLYDPTLGRFLSCDNYVQEPNNSQNFNRYSYCFNNPLRYVDPDGNIAWFVPVIAGAVIGGYVGASIESGTFNFTKWDSGAWKGAIAGAIVGATIGYGVSSVAGLTTTGEGALVNGAGTVSSIINSGTTNIMWNTLSGGGWDGAWKAGVAGLATGTWTVTGGFGMVKGFGTSSFGKLAGKLGYQMTGTTMDSMGDNWAKGRGFFSKMRIGIGPITLVLGKNVSFRDYIQSNVCWLATNTIFAVNALSRGEKIGWDLNNFELTFYNGNPNGKAYGAYTIWGDPDAMAHEYHHLWQARSTNQKFFPNYILHGLMGALTGKNGDRTWTGFGHLADCFVGPNNPYEAMAYDGYWWPTNY